MLLITWIMLCFPTHCSLLLHESNATRHEGVLRNNNSKVMTSMKQVGFLLRGEPKSGTTLVEFFMRSLLLNYCGVMGFDVFFIKRKVECITDRERILSFDVKNKHDILTSHVAFKLFPLLAGRHPRSSSDLHHYLKLPSLTYVKHLDTKHHFLLVLREPLSVLQSRYFYVTKEDDISQLGLDNFANEKGYETFANIASRYIIHHEFLYNMTLYWYYDKDPVDNVKSILHFFGIEDKVSNIILEVAATMSSLDTMHNIEELGYMPGTSRRHEKVRRNHSISISKHLAEDLIFSHGGLLPEELRQQWYPQ